MEILAPLLEIVCPNVQRIPDWDLIEIEVQPKMQMIFSNDWPTAARTAVRLLSPVQIWRIHHKVLQGGFYLFLHFQYQNEEKDLLSLNEELFHIF